MLGRRTRKGAHVRIVHHPPGRLAELAGGIRSLCTYPWIPKVKNLGSRVLLACGSHHAIDSARAMRAILLATAIAATFGGLRANSCVSQGYFSGARLVQDGKRANDQNAPQVSAAVLGDGS